MEREVKEGRLTQTAIDVITADKLRAVDAVLQIESTLDNVKRSLMKLDTIRQELNGTEWSSDAICLYHTLDRDRSTTV